MAITQPDIKELRAIVDWVNLTDDVRELSLKYRDVELFISRDQPTTNTTPAPAPAAPAPVQAPAAVPAQAAATPVQASVAAQAAAPSAETSSSGDLAADEELVKAPMVGIFYGSPKPGAPSFVMVGDRVEAGQVLAIVEVMKLMNNIEAPVAGTVSRIFVDNEQAVEYGQALMVISRD
jgi:acetyl-CoA carboxylase biotin carboxyl carrier protein